MDTSSINSMAALMGAPVDAAEQAKPATPDQRALIQAVKAVNAAEMFGQNNELTFILDRNTRQAVVRIVNRDTREVVRQIPAEYVLRMAEENQRS